MATIPANNNTGLYNTSGTAAVVSNDITVSGNINANNVNAVNTINAGTNITAGGNVTADYFIGDGSLLTNINAGNIVGSYGNANVAAYLASGSNSSNIVTSGNISGQYIFGNGSQLTGLPATYGNANVNAHLAAFGSNTINTTGNITAGYFIGDGSQLTGLPAVYGNANVAAFLPTYTGNLAGGNGAITNDLVVGGTIFGTFSGNISGNLVVPGSNTQVLFNNNGNAGASADFTFNDATNLLTVSGNVNATAFNGSGAGLTNLPGANVTGTVPLATAATTAGTVTTAAQPNITSVGTLTSLTTSGNVTVGGSLNSDDITSTGNVTVNGNQIITGNLTVQGTTTTINSNTITTNDKTITVANNQSTGALVDGAGLEAGNPAVATWLYDNASLTWKSSIGVSAVGNITGSYIFGNGSQLTGLPAGYSNADVNAHLAAFGSNTISTSGNVTAGNLLSSNFQATNSAGGALKNASGTTQASWGGGGGNNFSINVSTNIDGANAAIDISPTGSGHVNIKPAGYVAIAPVTVGSMNNVIIGNATPAAANLTTLGTTGNITTAGILTDGYYYANGTPVTFGGGSTYGNSNVAAFLAAFGSNSIVTTGNANVSRLNASTISVTGGISGATSISGTNITAFGNVDSTYFNGTGVVVSANISAGGNITGANLNLTGNIITSTGTLNIQDVNVNGNIILDGLAGAGSSGANIDYINGGGYARFFGNVTTASGSFIAGTPGSGGIRYPNIDGTTGQVLTTYGNGVSYWNSPTVYGNSNVTSLLAAFGSNTISTTGNITGGNIAATSNISGGNISITGTLIAGGNISGNYILGNGSQLTGIVATSSYSNANVAAYLASGTNSSNIVTTGNVTGTYLTTTGAAGNITGVNYIFANYFSGNGSSLTSITGANVTGTVPLATTATTAGTVTTNAQPNITSIGTLSSLSVSGNITTGGILTNGYYYANGTPVTFGGSGSPGGANTQIQFNNGGAFAGNAAMTFNNTTGNIGLGNLVVNADNLRNVNAINLNATPSSQRITVGTGYNGNFGANVDPFFISRGGTFAVIDKYNIGNADTNMAQRLTTSTLYADMGGATLTNNARRMQGLQGALFLGNGTQQISTGPVYATATGMGGAVAVGNITGTGGSVIDMGGTATVSHIAGGQMTATIGANANVGNAVGMLSVVQTFTGTSSNTTSALGVVAQFTGVPVSTVAPTNVYGFYMPGTTATHGVSNANNWRRASNYYFLRNDDPVAQNQLGSLRAFHEFEHATATSGSITINKNDGQVQNIVPTGNVTISGYSNFVVTASDGTNNDPQVDTVTIIVEQGATPYTITMPTGAAFKYAGGANTVPATANTVVMISVTAANIAGTTTYLTTISPEFS